MFGCAVIQALEICECRNLLSVLFVTAHRPVRKPKRKSRIRIIACSFDSEARFGDFGVSLMLDFFLSFKNFLCLTPDWIDGASDVDHRIVSGVNGCFAAAVKLFAERDSFQLR